MEITVESIRDQLPYYLTQEMKAGIVEELKKFPSGMQYFLTRQYLTEMLQGDGWTRLHLRNFANGDKIFVNGVILSNTCDVTPENVRDLPVNIVFAPLIALDAYIRRLEMAGVPKPNIDDKVASIRQQRITNLFYVPAGGGLDADHIVLLDDIHTMPAKVYEEEKGKGKIFTLSQSGFYLFILKLSIHFCRFHENLARA